ncbi:MAG: HAD family hydrolase [Oscillospiraceae bacterium]|nr:HAD family hydrolase [Oscillospiraceae bacterium]MCL2279316.1 HAD family hydrolase [Oscillospiraceae bacterium]
MVNTVLFDLDGTLLRMGQKEFLEAYISRLTKVFARMGYDVKTAVDALWAGTAAMVRNDGSALNRDRFWETFAEKLSLSDSEVSRAEAACDSFYQNEFDEVKSVAVQSDISAKLVRNAVSNGYLVVLATNPLFPLCAVEKRLSWIGLNASDFSYVTHYGNSSFCKPNPEYYKQVLNAIKREPQECLMIGNNPAEDMVACSLGIEGFLVSGYLEGEFDPTSAAFKHGSLEDLRKHFAEIFS